LTFAYATKLLLLYSFLYVFVSADPTGGTGVLKKTETGKVALPPSFATTTPLRLQWRAFTLTTTPLRGMDYSTANTTDTTTTPPTAPATHQLTLDWETKGR
jgi:hypothetical protein